MFVLIPNLRKKNYNFSCVHNWWYAEYSMNNTQKYMITVLFVIK